MRVRFLAAGLAVPTLLVGLVALLATMQYRWIGQVSEAERQQMERSLMLRAREFADDFDREITRLFLSLQLRAEHGGGAGEEVWPAALERWRSTARFPQMAAATYLAAPAGDGYSLRRFEEPARRFSAPLSAWPAKLAPLRARLPAGFRTITGTGGSDSGQFISISAPPLMPEIPAVVIPVPSPVAADLTNVRVARRSPDAPVARGGSSGSDAESWESAAGGAKALGAMRWLQAPRSYLIVELDLEVLRKTVLPTLVARHFPKNDATPYRVSVWNDAARIYPKGLTPGEPILPMRYDVSVLFFRVRPELVGDVLAPAVTVTSNAPPGGAAAGGTGVTVLPAPAAEPRQFSIFVQQWSVNGRSPGTDGRIAMRQASAAAGGWRLMLQHAAGSLDVAVAQARRRNLALSFGILTVLAAGVMLVVINARRTRQLAARQIDFVATVTHELRTPLAVIRSAAQNLSAGVVAEPVQAKTYGDLIDKEGRRLTDMVEQVLAYAGLEEGKAPRMAQRVDLSRLVNDVLDACQPLCTEAGIAVEFDADAAAAAPAVTGDEAGLRLVVQNLVTNAIKHGADGRWIGVSVAEAGHHGRAEVCVAISDRGRGIEAAELPHVFDPFYRGRRALDDQVRGNGLGLSLVKRIVEAHGGRAGASSSPGAGATFTICLPAEGAERRP
jgi:signal transduction histidine kinase